MSLAKKLQIKTGQKLRLLHAPKGLEFDVPTTRSKSADAIIVFIKHKAEIESFCEPFFEAARSDHLAWIAYPKAGQLDTDLNRDILWSLMKSYGIKPVRQIAIDDLWSALRFRPA